MTKAKIAVYSCPFDAMGTETKGTVLLKSAAELMEFSKGEEQLIEQVCFVAKRLLLSVCVVNLLACGAYNIPCMTNVDIP